MRNNNLYNYKTPKSGNDEIGIFNIKGRINRKSFILRCLFSLGLVTIFKFLSSENFFSSNDSRIFIFFETIYIYILPIFILFFILIQGAKRMHDVNKSGWNFFIPLYNIHLSFSPGSKGNNDYGIDPSPVKNIQYFDQIESKKQFLNEGDSNSLIKIGLDNCRDYLNNFRKKNTTKDYHEILEVIGNAIKWKKPSTIKSIKTPRVVSNKYLSLLAIIIVAFLYYIAYYEAPLRQFTYEDTLIDTTLSTDTLMVNEISEESLPNNETDNIINSSESLLLGTKTFGTHWIEPYGQVDISKNGSKIYITGLQSNGSEYCMIDGFISIIDDRNFLFNGEISLLHYTTDYDSNSGTFLPVTEQKLLTGEFKFRRIGSRKFWRLKQPDSQTGYFDYSYHYIDIFMQ